MMLVKMSLKCIIPIIYRGHILLQNNEEYCVPVDVVSTIKKSEIQ